MKPEFKLDIEILERIALAYSEKKSLKKTHMHLVSRLRWDSFLRYLAWLERNNFIECKSENGNKEFMLTTNGREMLDNLMKFLVHVNNDNLTIDQTPVLIR